jgi:hypothetical protein
MAMASSWAATRLIGALRDVESLSHADTACVALSVVQFARNIATWVFDGFVSIIPVVRFLAEELREGPST